MRYLFVELLKYALEMRAGDAVDYLSGCVSGSFLTCATVGLSIVFGRQVHLYFHDMKFLNRNSSWSGDEVELTTAEGGVIHLKAGDGFVKMAGNATIAIRRDGDRVQRIGRIEKRDSTDVGGNDR